MRSLDILLLKEIEQLLKNADLHYEDEEKAGDLMENFADLIVGEEDLLTVKAKVNADYRRVE